MNRRCTYVAVIFGLLSPSAAIAGIITSRSELNTALGRAAITEDFESWDVPGDQLEIPGTAQPLDSSSVISGQGPGIVNDGLEFSNLINPSVPGSFTDMTLDRRPAFFPSAVLNTGSHLVIDFIDPVTHAGFDYDRDNFFTVVIDVYGSDDSTLLTTFAPGTSGSFGGFVFFGYSDANGIGRITVDSNNVRTDDLTYGDVSTVPEPSSLVLLTTGALSMCGYGWRRRKRKQADS